MEILRMVAPCIFGLESTVAFELTKLGAQNVRSENGRVFFCGDMLTAAKANLWLRCGERVLIVLGCFTATSFESLFDQVAALPVERFLSEDAAFPVKGWSLNSKLHSVPDCQAIIKRALVRRMETVYHRKLFPETGSVHQIQFSIMKDEVTIMLDTSGEGLHKRGWRKNANAAPIKETLAAGIVDIVRVKSDSTVVDPFCGSGTLLIESTLKALNVAPGINRRFAMERWKECPENAFRLAREEALDLVKRDAGFMAYGFDIDPSCVELTRENAKKAGVLKKIKVEQRDIRHFQNTYDNAIVLCNPPYGERMLEMQQAQQLTEEMGRVFPKKEGVSYNIISPLEDFEKRFGRQADRRRKLYNGTIKCQLYMYFR